MSDRDDSVRKAFEALAGQAGDSGPACPTDDRIWAAARGELSTGETRALLDHTAGCAACLEAWRLAREVASAAPEAARARRASPSRAGWWVAAAAAIVAAVALGVFLPGWRSTAPEPAMRAGEAVAIRPMVPPDAELPRNGITLRWSAAHEGARYHVRVTSETLDPLYEARELSDPEARVPPERLDGVAEGERLLWRVEAILPDGTRLDSPTFSVVVAAPEEPE